MPPPHEAFAVDDADEGKLAEFLYEFHSDDLRRILVHPEPNLHFSHVIDYAELLEFDPGVAKKLYHNHRDLLPLFNTAAFFDRNGFNAAAFSGRKDFNFNTGAQRAQREMLENPEELKRLASLGESRDAVQKEFVHVRVNVSRSPLEFPELCLNIGKVRVNHRGILLTLKGTVIRSGGVKMIEREREYQCRKCNYRFLHHPDLEAGNRIALPASCPSTSSRGCRSASFQLIGESVTCHDYQEIKIQESVQLLDVGSIPCSMPVVLMDDLNIVKAGDDVIVTGILSAKWSSDVKDVRCNLDPMLIANYVRRTNELKSGIDTPDETIKKFDCFWAENGATPLKVALTSIGGVQHVDASGTKVRGEPHMLLVGDPGTSVHNIKYGDHLLCFADVVHDGGGVLGHSD